MNINIEILDNPCLNVIVPSTLYNEPLHVVVGGELGQGQQALHGDGLVDLGHLLEDPHKGHVPEWLSVLLDGGEVFTSINKLEFLINLMKLKYIKW